LCKEEENSEEKRKKNTKTKGRNSKGVEIINRVPSHSQLHIFQKQLLHLGVSLISYDIDDISNEMGDGHEVVAYTN